MSAVLLIKAFLNFSAKDCRQKRPGEVFNKVKSKADPKIIDAEYEAFLNDMDGKAGGGRGRGSKSADAASAREADKKLPSIQGGIGTGGGLFSSIKPPLMLTNGSAAPGAASAQVRSHSNTTQMAGGAFIVSLEIVCVRSLLCFYNFYHFSLTDDGYIYFRR